MIETKSFSISKQEYTKLIIYERLKKSKWLYLIMFLLGLFYLQDFGDDNLITFLTFYFLGYPIFIIVYLYFWANSKEHQPIFSETYLLFDTEFIYIKRNGNETKLNPNSIQKIISKSNYWMLYISKGQFIYVPKNIFFSQEDFDSFLVLINFK